ncbi:helix-turn-helix transcriptional regulator [Lihuaxuella thermophila]|uniref:Predicted DNA-binding transcriptional regulator YafY, contains an HTH and WYL domains n=1 Tax=Lihuaxuella thermophila TaxID=1173111 RepID=A0A1H8E6E3_9BACL|nr:WYL domain-containing protein [Lihuaxuella thermophila]SEN15045.1 Predicted DNA-binding transcriptional regulator YafY, contains an HTH and WYL domains [Lihuaxuella thermophila]
MKKQARVERLFDMIARLLVDPGPHSIKETAQRYGVSERQIRKDIDVLIKLLNEPNQKEYIIKKHGKYEGNFSRSLASLNSEVRLYLFLALKQVEPLLQNARAYESLFKHACSVLSENDVKCLKEWSRFYHISRFGYPKKRSHFYQSLHEVFDAILLSQVIRFTHKNQVKYLDPFMVYYTKSVFYIIGNPLYEPDLENNKVQLRHYRLDRLQELRRLVQFRSPLEKEGKYHEVLSFKEEQAKVYLAQMLEAESYQGRKDYRLYILDEKVFERISEKEWHRNQQITPIRKKMNGKYVYGEIRIPRIASPTELKEWVLRWGSAMEVVEPIEFKKEIEQEVKLLYERIYKIGPWK